MIQDYFYDTEFFERGPHNPIDLISIGVKRRIQGWQYYAVSNEFPLHEAWHHPSPGGGYWLRENVLKKLPLVKRESGEVQFDSEGTPRLDLTSPVVKSLGEIRNELEQFFELNQKFRRRLWAWYADYDHVVLSQIWGTMVQLPEGMRMFTHDLKQIIDLAGNPPMPAQRGEAHNAMADAEHLHHMFVHALNLGIIDPLPLDEDHEKILRRRYPGGRLEQN